MSRDYACGGAIVKATLENRLGTTNQKVAPLFY